MPGRLILSGQSVTPSAAATVCMSLSPRPLRPTNRSWSGRIVRATLHRVVDRVRRLQRRDDALGCAERLEAFERLLRHRRRRTRARSVVFQPAVLRADAGIVEPGRDAVRFEHLAVLVLQQVACACRAARPGAPATSVAACCPVPTPSPRRLDADQPHAGHRRRGGTGRSRCCRRRRRRSPHRAACPPARASARAPRCR